ncbi:MAG: hypothetical protein ABSB24_19510 [Gaiellaceae bacterium]|jgi:hypothetical protein
MARLGMLRPGPIVAAIALYDVWRRLTPAQRTELVRLARTHGPTVARTAMKLRSRSR